MHSSNTAGIYSRGPDGEDAGMGPRVFTPDEANALLPEVVPLAEAMVARAGALREAESARASLLARIATNGGDLPPSELAEAARAAEDAEEALLRAVEEVERLGVQVKDAQTGLLDFPALRQDEPVLLCWQLGEDAVAYWHSVEEGYAGRRPLPL